LTAEQLEAARAERMRQNGHGAITLEDVRTWIEETGLCIFLPRSAQAGFTAPTFVEAVAGQRTAEPTLQLVSAAEELLVRLEADGVAVRLNLAGQPGDQPDYVVAGWVLPYVYALRGDRDWRRSPQLTGSRQVSQLAVQAAKQIDLANQNAAQIRDALGREVTETAVFRALHELWKQLRIIPVVPEPGRPALWQPLRQRFQKAIAEGASTSQVTAISVLASIYLQAVIAASMEEIEQFLSPLTSRSKIREVVRGLAATRQVHSTTMGHSPMFYVAGTLPEFPVTLGFNGADSLPSYLGSSYAGSSHSGTTYRNRYQPRIIDEEVAEPVTEIDSSDAFDSIDSIDSIDTIDSFAASASIDLEDSDDDFEGDELSGDTSASDKYAHAFDSDPVVTAASAQPRPRPAARPISRAAAARPRTTRSATPENRRRTPASRNSSSAHSSGPSRGGNGAVGRPGTPSRSASSSRPTPINGAKNGHASNGTNGHSPSKANGAGRDSAPKPRTSHSNGSKPANGSNAHKPANGAANGARFSKTAGHSQLGGTHKPDAAKSARSGTWSPRPAGKPAGNGTDRSAGAANGHRPDSRNASNARPPAAKPTGSGPKSGVQASAAKRLSFTGQAKQAPKPAGFNARIASKPASPVASKSRGGASRPSGRTEETKRRG
jgi:23S rRNA pseudouridine2605 synthase